MRIDKIINNNVVSARDEQDKEVIIMGKGIGFQAKKGNLIPEDKIEKVFKIENPESYERFKTLLENLPLEHLQVSNEIITYTKAVLNKKLNQNIYITLTDHINFAVERYKQNMMFHNALLWEVKTFYHEEYMIGQYAVQLINKKLAIDLPEDEVASIALHIVNAEYNAGMSHTMKSAKMIPEILKIVSDFFEVEVDDTTLYYERFILHLKCLLQGILIKEISEAPDQEFSQMITQLYPEEMRCAQKIVNYIQETYEYLINEEEQAHLAIHIKKVRKI